MNDITNLDCWPLIRLTEVVYSYKSTTLNISGLRPKFQSANVVPSPVKVVPNNSFGYDLARECRGQRQSAKVMPSLAKMVPIASFPYNKTVFVYDLSKERYDLIIVN
jgi:hypothetical protein